MKLHVVTETDGRRNSPSPATLNRFKLGALRLEFQHYANVRLILKEPCTEVKKWNSPFREKSGCRE